jgi:hypothetical protein
MNRRSQSAVKPSAGLGRPITCSHARQKTDSHTPSPGLSPDATDDPATAKRLGKTDCESGFRRFCDAASETGAGGKDVTQKLIGPLMVPSMGLVRPCSGAGPGCRALA